MLAGLVVVVLSIVWAAHDGGYDSDTWYWGALLLLLMSAGLLIGFGPRLRLSRLTAVALAAFAGYVAWSYLSIGWAQSPGDALAGSNRALLYLLAFGLMVALPWRPRSALVALLLFTGGVGVIGAVLLIRLAAGDHVGQLVIQGRLASPTGYINSTAALFTVGALLAISLAARRELPVLLRGVLVAFACAGFQLALIVQSRGWLFTLPLVLLAAFAVAPDRLRVLAFSVFPAVAVLAPLHDLLQVYKSAPGAALDHAAARAGKDALAICGAMLIGAALVAWGERLTRFPALGERQRRVMGAIATAVAVLVVCAGGVAATHGHPVRFISRQWHGFSHVQTVSSGSHFAAVGSGRYDFWRVSIDAFVAHPIGGLGQDNFAEYYLPRRRTAQEPNWTHSLELRLLAHTGIVGFVLFALFLAAALAAAIRVRRGPDRLAGAVAGAALLPLVVWLIHGSVDWFWEMPALSGPALGFTGMAAAMRTEVADRAGERPARRTRGRARSALLAAGCAAAFAAALVALVFPYLSVREVSIAANAATRAPAAALHNLSLAADLNPLDASPDRIAGTVALKSGSFSDAQRHFAGAISRDPGGWFNWLGAGLAASALGERARAHHELAVAAAINARQPAVSRALALVFTRHPLSADQALRMLLIQVR